MAVQRLKRVYWGRLTVSATEMVSFREVRREVTSLRMGRMEDGGKVDAIAELWR